MRYLFQQMSKMACCLPRMLALGYLALRSCGVFQSAFSTSAAHESTCERASGYLSLNFCSRSFPISFIVGLESYYLHVPNMGIVCWLGQGVKSLPLHNYKPRNGSHLK